MSLSSPTHACLLPDRMVKENYPAIVFSLSFGEGELKSTRHNVMMGVCVCNMEKEKGRKGRREAEIGEEGKIYICNMTHLLPARHSPKRNKGNHYVTWIGSEGPTLEARTWSIKLWSRGEKTET